jgi:hypothetical protein
MLSVELHCASAALFSANHRIKIQGNKTPNVQGRIAHFSHAVVALLSVGIGLSPTLLQLRLLRQVILLLLLLRVNYLRRLEIWRG